MPIFNESEQPSKTNLEFHCQYGHYLHLLCHPIRVCLFILTLAFRVAFTDDNHDGSPLHFFELVLDIVLALNMVMQFFTGIEINDKVEYRNSKIFKKYMMFPFWIDALSCLPGLLTLEHVEWVFYFKFLRYF